jgi:hypothetical protein
VVTDVLERFQNAVSNWKILVNCSFLSPEKKQKYLELLKNRWDRLGIKS